MAEDITIAPSDVTEVELNGGGMFDLLMRSMKAHLHEEFKAGRINQAAYADVYLGSTQNAMAQAVQFVLSNQVQEKQAELLDAQKDLVAEQVLTEQKNRDLVDAQINKTNAEVNLLIKELDRMDAEIAGILKNNDLIDQQILKLQKDIIYTDAQIALSQEQLNKLIAETALTYKQVDKVNQDILYSEQQVLKAKEEVTLLQEQVLTAPIERDRVQRQVYMLDQQINNAGQEYLLIQENITKTNKEAGLLAQKIFTEEANIKDIVDGDDVAGLIGRKIALYCAQEQGFYRDAEQKAAKIYGDFWNIVRTTNTETPADVILGTGSSEILKVLNKLRAGVDAS